MNSKIFETEKLREMTWATVFGQFAVTHMFTQQIKRNLWVGLSHAVLLRSDNAHSEQHIP